MKLGFSFFGIIYGSGGRTGSNRDFRHCWPGIKRDLIDPFVAQGHEAKIYFSGYRIKDEDVEKEFYDLVKPDRVIYSHYPNSDSFTTKYAAFNNFQNEDIDAVVFTRSDIHFSRIIANEDIQWDKFNFLFQEEGWWDHFQFTCDNFYIIPKKYLNDTMKALETVYRWPRPQWTDTHGLYPCLRRYIEADNMHFISKTPEISDINSFYTLCRTDLPEGEDRMRHMHPEVAERYNYGRYN